MKSHIFIFWNQKLLVDNLDLLNLTRDCRFNPLYLRMVLLYYQLSTLIYFWFRGKIYKKWDFTSGVSDWWCHLRKHIGRNVSNYFMYQWAVPIRSPPPLRAPASQSSHPPLLMFYQAAFATLAERRETEKQRISEKVQSIPASRNA